MPEDRPTHDEKLALILRAAAAIFAEKGYDRASIRDISRATGVSLSGLYYYFNSKEELLYLIQRRCFEAVLGNLERVLAGVTDPELRLRLLIENHLRFFVSNMKEMKVLSHEADALTGEYRRRVHEQKKRYTEICASILEELRPEESAIELRVATFSLFGMLNWIYNWYDPARDVPVGELADQVSRLFLSGYRAGSDPAVSVPGAGESALGESRPSVW